MVCAVINTAGGVLGEKRPGLELLVLVPLTNYK